MKKKYTRPAREMPVIDLDWLRCRCTQDADAKSDCLIWDRQIKHGPITTIGGSVWKVRHLAWGMAHKHKLKRSYAPMPTVCEDERCVNPDHLTLVKRNSHQLGTKMPLLHRLHITQAKRASAKLTEQQAQAIRTSAETLKALAQRHGVALSLVHRIKTGKSWPDHRNPFLQLAT